MGISNLKQPRARHSSPAQCASLANACEEPEAGWASHLGEEASMQGADLTAGDAVAQSAIDLAEQLLVDGPEDKCAELDGVDDETRGDEHIAEDQVAQKLGLQQPDEVHDVGILKIEKCVWWDSSRWEKDPGLREVSETHECYTLAKAWCTLYQKQTTHLQEEQMLEVKG